MNSLFLFFFRKKRQKYAMKNENENWTELKKERKISKNSFPFYARVSCNKPRRQTQYRTSFSPSSFSSSSFCNTFKSIRTELHTLQLLNTVIRYFAKTLSTSYLNLRIASCVSRENGKRGGSSMLKFLAGNWRREEEKGERVLLDETTRKPC